MVIPQGDRHIKLGTTYRLLYLLAFRRPSYQKRQVGDGHNHCCLWSFWRCRWSNRLNELDLQWGSWWGHCGKGTTNWSSVSLCKFRRRWMVKIVGVEKNPHRHDNRVGSSGGRYVNGGSLKTPPPPSDCLYPPAFPLEVDGCGCSANFCSSPSFVVSVMTTSSFIFSRSDKSIAISESAVPLASLVINLGFFVSTGSSIASPERFPSLFKWDGDVVFCEISLLWWLACWRRMLNFLQNSNEESTSVLMVRVYSHAGYV